MKKLFLIDGHALIFRSYYAFLRRPMINSKGVDTSILFGFTKTLIDLIIKEKPTHLAVAFDPPAKTFRHQAYDLYKANRSETPELIKSSLTPLIELVEAMSIPVVMKDGFEADDVVGTIAKEAEKKGFTVFMVSPDKDYGQLISDNIYQYKPAKSGGDPEVVGRKELCEQFGITDPIQIIDILTLWGDASDNIPGVRGIGEVGSKRLIQKYGNLDNIYKAIKDLPEKQQLALNDAKSHIEMSKYLVTIDINVDIPWNEDAVKLEVPHFNELKKLFAEYEFGSLTRSISQIESIFSVTDKDTEAVESHKSASESIFLSEPSYSLVNIEELKKAIDKTKSVGIKIDGQNLYCSSEDKVFSISISNAHSLKDILEDDSITICGYDLKAAIHIFKSLGVKIKGYLADIELMHYLIMPERAHKIDILAKAYLSIELTAPEALVQKSLFDQEETNLVNNNKQHFIEVSLLSQLYTKLKDELSSSNLLDLYNNIEMPLIYVLADMEEEGIKIDISKLSQYSLELKLELAGIETRIKELANDETINISSPKQLGVLLFDKLKLVEKAKTTSKKNYSTDEETLMELIDKHPIIQLILEYRNIKKLINTYIDPLPLLISPANNKLHTTYNQALTATGRLSSIKPNLQNIPIRTERGKEIRKAFIPSNIDGYIMSADYSQIELRLMAFMSNDKDFIGAFRDNKDIHTATASKVFKITESEVTKEQRSRAKTANFGIIYGISAFGLSQRLQISRSDSKKLIDDYFASYPQVKEYITNMIDFAKANGFVQTLYGRKRFLPDITSKNPIARGLAERNAVNAPIQGSAADIIKVAMINVCNRIKKEGLRSKMVLQVHDELVFDVIPNEIEILSKIVKEEMESVIDISIPLTVECEYGANWLEAH